MTEARGSDFGWVPDDPAGVLAAVREQRARELDAAAKTLVLAVAWAGMHATLDAADAAGWTVPGSSELVPLAGEGAPWVEDLAVAELTACLGMSPTAGRALLADALELAHRLPRLYAAVQAGQVPAWRARAVAQQTTHLTREAAGFVDAQVWHCAGRVGHAALMRLVEEATARFMPETALKQAQAAADRRHVTVWGQSVSFDGTSQVTAELDLADALDLDDALAAAAAHLKTLGCDAGLDARRALALGELARTQLTLNLTSPAAQQVVEQIGPVVEEGAPAPVTKPLSGRPLPTRSSGPGPRRSVTLYVHLSQAALTASGLDHDPGHGCQAGLQVGRVENTGDLVTTDTIRAWLQAPGTTVTVKPVLDLADHVRVDQAEIPDRITERVALRDGHCVHPYCTRPARRLRPDQHGCDRDHTTPSAQGGVTCTCQLAPLCRLHHRGKTHTAWRYHCLEPGTYLWTSPHGYQYLVDDLGTTDVSTDATWRRQPRHPDPQPPPDPPLDTT